MSGLKKERSMNWLSLIGISVALIGTLICALNSLGYAHRLPIFNDIDYGLATIKNMSANDSKGRQIGLLKSDEKGFKRLSNIIKSNIPDGLPLDESKGIMKKKGMSFNSGDRSVDMFNALYFVYITKEPFLIGSEAMVAEWVKTYKFRYILTFGFGIIFLGFLFRFASHF